MGFIAASLFGMAAHLRFLIALGALGVWAIAVLFRRPAVPVVRTLAHLTVLFGVQVIAATLYGAVAWNNLVIGGGAFMVYFDAQTGEVQGERPYSWIKITLAVVAAVTLIGGIAWAINAYGG